MLDIGIATKKRVATPLIKKELRHSGTIYSNMIQIKGKIMEYASKI